MKRIIKKFKTIFFSTIAILLPIVFVTNLIILVVAYKNIYDSNYERCQEEVIVAANVIEDYVGIYDLEDAEDVAQCNESLCALCREFKITYAYVVRIDIEKKEETYVTLGYGENAAESFIKNRHSGDTVKGYVNQQQIDTVTGKAEHALTHESNKIDDTIICYVPLKHIYNSDTKTFEESANTDCVVAAEMSFSEVMENFSRRFNTIAVLTVILSFVMVLAFATVMHLMISRPARKISKSMSDYTAHRDRKFEKLPVKYNTEFSEMSRSFNAMTDEIEHYISDIDKLNKEKHMQEAELNIATNIQLGLLRPSTYRNENYNVDAYILPARVVGGDLYDYHILPDGRINLVVADVSGKGVSAALFMSRALTLIHMYARLGYSAKQMLFAFNNTLAEQNPQGLFITAFAAQYNPATRELTYSNAGHNNPYIISDTLIELGDARGMAAGIFAGEEYEEKTITLKPGDVLFMYTDGVNEAQNAAGELWGDAALAAVLRAHCGDKKQGIMDGVRHGIETFAQGAEQSDDITMLCFKTQGAFYHKKIEVDSKLENIRLIEAELERIPGISDALRLELNLMAEEIYVNICKYAYSDKSGKIEFMLNVADTVEMTFRDSGMPYDPTKNLLDIEEYDHEHTVGGLGKFITFQMADDYSYKYRKGQNVLKLVKNIPPAPSSAE